jgi:hypothetical protein
MTEYLQSLTATLHDLGMLTDQLKEALLKHDLLWEARDKQETIILRFGKYKGQSVQDVALSDIKYLKWLGAQTWCSASIRNAISYHIS